MKTFWKQNRSIFQPQYVSLKITNYKKLIENTVQLSKRNNYSNTIIDQYNMDSAINLNVTTLPPVNFIKRKITYKSRQNMETIAWHWWIRGMGCQGSAHLRGPNLFLFMQFSARNLQNDRLAHPLWKLVLPHRKILETPLHGLGY